MRAKHGKTSKMALRVLSTATFLTMVASCAAPVFADNAGIALYGTYYVDEGSISVEVKDGNHYVNGELDTDGWVIIKNSRDETKTGPVDNTVTINTDKGNTADITLDNVNIDASKKDEAAVTVKGDGTTNIELNGNNTLKSGEGYSSGHAGLEKSTADGSGTLIIKDDKNDDGTVKSDEQKKQETEEGTGASLTANGANDGAGIGAGTDGRNSTSNIEITGGKITAIGSGSGAGIGGSKSSSATGIIISGGNITAISGDDGSSSIGGGFQSSTVDVTISGGKINASSTGAGAGIGGGEGGKGEVKVTITGGDIESKSSFGAGIGTGRNSDSNLTFNISGTATNINATSEQGAGIGSGDTAYGEYDITIDDGTVNATGSTGIGVGSTCENTGADIKISGGKITATGTLGGAGIGNGQDTCESKPTNIIITGGEITAKGANGAAGIGDGWSNYDNTVNVTITGGNITAIGGKGASAIGGGQYEGGSNPIINVKIDSSNESLKIAAKVTGSGKGAIGDGTKEGKDPFSGVDFNDITAKSLGEDHGALVQFYNNYDETTGEGELYKTIHNKKYITENYEDHPDDDHAWTNPTIIKVATPEEDGIIRYTCDVEGCPETLDVPYKYVAPTPDPDPDTPDPVTPVTPDPTPDEPTVDPVTPENPVNPPVQDATADDTTPSDAPVTPDNAELPPVQDARADDMTETPVTPAKAVNPPVQDAHAAPNGSVLPQTGANWLAVLGSTISGMFLMAAGFVLNRKSRRSHN